mgnify:CR=1 FL=1
MPHTINYESNAFKRKVTKMKEFKKFVRSEHSRKKPPGCDMNIPEELPGIDQYDPKDVNMIRELTEKYQGNRERLIHDIKALAEKNKKDGKLNTAQLENFEKKIAPMLNSEQKKMLKNIMDMIK